VLASLRLQSSSGVFLSMVVVLYLLARSFSWSLSCNRLRSLSVTMDVWSRSREISLVAQAAKHSLPSC
jgi:hypothetical protein